MATISSDHADESMNMSQIPTSAVALKKQSPRLITIEEIKQHNGKNDDNSFWAVVDNFVVDATSFLESHPGGLRKLLSTDKARVGATGKPFGFSFSRGKNAHFPDTGRKFCDGVKQYLVGKSGSVDKFLPPMEVDFSPHGKLIIIGRLEV